MKRLFLFLFFLDSFFASNAQFPATNLKQNFKWGVALGTRDSTAYGANDSLVAVINRQGRMMYRSTDGFWKVLANSNDSAAILSQVVRTFSDQSIAGKKSFTDTTRQTILVSNKIYVGGADTLFSDDPDIWPINTVKTGFVHHYYGVAAGQTNSGGDISFFKESGLADYKKTSVLADKRVLPGQEIWYHQYSAHNGVDSIYSVRSIAAVVKAQPSYNSALGDMHGWYQIVTAMDSGFKVTPPTIDFVASEGRTAFNAPANLRNSDLIRASTVYGSLGVSDTTLSRVVNINSGFNAYINNSALAFRRVGASFDALQIQETSRPIVFQGSASHIPGYLYTDAISIALTRSLTQITGYMIGASNAIFSVAGSEIMRYDNAVGPRLGVGIGGSLNASFHVRGNTLSTRAFLVTNNSNTELFRVNNGGEIIANTGFTGIRVRATSLVVNKDSLPITTANVWAAMADTTGGAASRINRRNLSAVHTGAIAFDTTARTLTINQLGGGTTSVVIPRGGSGGGSGIIALSSSRTGNLVTVSGDNGSSTIFSIRDADSTTRENLTPSFGISGSAYNGAVARTWAIDTTSISTKDNVTASLLPKVNYTDTAAMLNGYQRQGFALLLQDTATALSNLLRISDTATMLASRLRISDTATMLLPFVQYSDTAAIVAGYTRLTRFTDSLAAVQVRIQTKQPIGNYITFADSSTILAGRWLPNRSADSIAVIRALANTKQPLGAYITLADSTTILAGRWLPNRSADSIAVIRALANSKGTGSVTSVATGVGLSGGTITTSGTISADTTTLSTRAYAAGLDVAKANTSLNNVNGVLSSTYGGAGIINGILKANGSGVVSPVIASDITTLISGTYLPLTAGSGQRLTGDLYSANNRFLYQRNVANSADVIVIGLDNADAVRIAPSGQTTQLGGALNGTSAAFSGNISTGAYLNFSSPTASIGAGTTNSGWLEVNSGTNNFNLRVNGGDRLHVTQNGNVLIKTTTDNGTDALQVAGSGLFTGAVTGTAGFISNTGNNGNAFDAQQATTGYQFLRLRNTSGNSQLAVEGSTAGAFFTGSSAYATLLGSATATDLGLATNGIVRLNIASTGAATFSSSGSFGGFISSGGRTTTFGYRLPDWRIYNTSGGALAFNNYTTDFLSIASSGAITASSSVTANSFVKSGGTSSQFLKADGSVDGSTYITSASVGNGTLTLNVSGSGLSGSQSFTANQSGNATFTVTSNATTAATASTIAYRDGSGNLTAVGFFESSDRRLKDIISRDGDVAYFKWKDGSDNKTHIGYIAQEVQKKNPDQVKADDKGFLSVNYTEVLVEKVRALEKRIEELEKRMK